LIPVTLLGRFAVASSFQKQGVGELLLFTALERALTLSRSVASAAVVVDAKDDSAMGFYSKYGFVAVLDAPRRLLLPMRIIESMFA
jgi:predicted GNAT family N-acyltransferase